MRKSPTPDILGRSRDRVVNPADIGEQGHRVSVAGLARTGRSGQGRPTPLALADELLLVLGAGVDRHLPESPSTATMVPGDGPGAGVLHDGGDAHLGGEDRGGWSAAVLGDDGPHQGRVEGRGLGGREVARDDDRRDVEVGDAGVLLAEQAGDDPVADILEVGDPFGEVAAEGLELRSIGLTASVTAVVGPCRRPVPCRPPYAGPCRGR